MQEVQIRIPRAQEGEIVNIPSGDLGISPKEAKRRFEKIDNLLFGIIASVVISGIAVVIAVTGLFIDQMRYNNAAYKEYSSKIDSTESTQQINNEILDQNQKNQQLIIDQYKQIQQLIGK
jgi:hypothetical protein